MDFNGEYLNKTVNKWPRGQLPLPSFVVLHETASPNASNPRGTLEYNLKASVQSSYNYLIARNGEIFHYVDERPWIAYHAGVHSAARGYIEWQVNVHSIGIELDGPNDGTPTTAAQRDSAIALMLYLRDEYGIPLDREHYLEHREVAPGYKSDPRGYRAAELVKLAQQAAAAQGGGLAFITPARIRADTFQYVMRKGTLLGMSPAAPYAGELYAIPLEYGLDPAVALAFFAHESQYGLDGVTKDYDLKNWGNVRTPYNAERSAGIVLPEKGGYVKFRTWQDGLRDWSERIVARYVQAWGLDTVEKAIPKYLGQPSGAPEVVRYLTHIRELLAAWQKKEKDLPEGKTHVDPVFQNAWQLSGGIWQSERLTPGYALTSVIQSGDAELQRFERGVARKKSNQPVEWLLDSEKVF